MTLDSKDQASLNILAKAWAVQAVEGWLPTLTARAYVRTATNCGDVSAMARLRRLREDGYIERRWGRSGQGQHWFEYRVTREVAQALGVIGPTTSGESTGAPAGTPHEDALDRLERLARLHREGALSTEEFEAKKRELLQQL